MVPGGFLEPCTMIEEKRARAWLVSTVISIPRPGDYEVNGTLLIA